MFAPARLYKKSIPLLLIAILLISFIVIVFDNHDMEFSSTCPVCRAKICLNGVQNPITCEFHPAVSYHYAIEQSPGIIILNVLSFEDRAPPEVHQN